MSASGRDNMYVFELRFDYYQFYIGDAAIDPDEFLETSWDDEQAVARGLAAFPKLLIVMSDDVGGATVFVEISHTRPVDAMDSADYVIEASLDVPSGNLSVDGYPPAVASVPHPLVSVQPDVYRVRIYHDYVDSFHDRNTYRIVLWPEPFTDAHVLREAPR